MRKNVLFAMLFMVTTAMATVTSSMEADTEAGCRASSAVIASESEYYFVVWLNEGGFVAYPFAENPQLTYNDGLLKVTTDVKDLEIEPDKVKKFTINNSMPGSSLIPETKMSNGKVQRGSDFVSFVGCSADMDVYVYTIGGALVKQAKTDSEGMLYLSLEDMDSGVYIIKSKEITCKILKK